MNPPICVRHTGAPSRLPAVIRLILLLAVFTAGCGPVTVNMPTVAANRKMAFALDDKGRFTFLPESRSRAIYLTDIYGNFLTRLSAEDSISGWCDFSPSNDMILFVEKTSDETGEDLYHLKVHNLKTNTEELEFISTRFIWFPRWSPNGKYIAFCGEGRNEITVINWRDNKIVYRVESNSVFYRWLPDVSGFLTVDILDEVDALDGDSLQYFVIRKKYFDPEAETEDLVRGYSRSCWPDISADGTRIVFNAVEFTGPTGFLVEEIKGKEQVYAYDATNRSVTCLTKGGIAAFYAVLSPDAAKVAFIDYEDDPLSGGDVWICYLAEAGNKLSRVWTKGNAVYPFWCEDDVLGFIAIDPDENMGSGFDDLLMYNLSSSSLTSLKDRLQELFKPQPK